MTDPRITFTDEKSLYGFIAKIMLEEEIDFVAGPVISHWHAIGVDALAYSIFQHENRKPSGVIVIGAHSLHGFRISEVDFICKNFATVKFCFLDSRSRTYEPVKDRGIRFIKTGMSFLLVMLAIRGNIRRENKGGKIKVRIASVLWPQVVHLLIFRNKCLADKYHPTFALIDEGIGTYMPKEVWDITRRLEDQRKYPNKHLEVLQRAITKMIRISSKLAEIVAVRYVSTEKLFLFNYKGSKLFLNEPVANSYKGVLARRAKAILRREQTKPLALIVTQWFALSPPVALELDLLQTVVTILVKTGYSIVLKPHPAEVIEKYAPVLARFEAEQIRLVQQKMPVEDLFASLQPTCVIGYTSTSLVTASALYGIPAITIIDIFLDTGVYSKLSNAGSELFKKMTKAMVYNADTFDKLEYILNSLKSNSGSV